MKFSSQIFVCINEHERQTRVAKVLNQMIECLNEQEKEFQNLINCY